MAGKRKRPPAPPDTSPEALQRRVVHRLRRAGRDDARLDALRRLGSIEDAEPATRRAIELWAQGLNPWRIAEDTGIPPAHIDALSYSPAARAHYELHRATIDAARVALGASVPWLDLWKAIKDR